MTGADCFVLALSRMMKSQGQNELIGQTQLELDGVPDVVGLKDVAKRFGEAHPLLDARVRRNIFTFVPSWVEGRGGNRFLDLNLWKEVGASFHSDFPCQYVESAHKISEDIINSSLERQYGVRNLRLDLVFLKGGGSILIFTWNHLLFDGKGAELLVKAFIESTNGGPISKPVAKSEIPIPIMDQLKKASAAKDRFFELLSNEYLSLSASKPRACRLRYKLLRFDPETTKKIQERAENLSGLFSISFYLACAARAHREAFLSRACDPTHYVSSIPVQVRRKSANGNPFQNQVTVLFFLLKRESLDTLQSAVEAAQKQFEEMTRKGLGPAFEMILRLMRRLPSYFYFKFLGAQFSGRIASFFHSSTGAFSFDKATVCGARVLDARHIPSVSAPPGSGLFFSESHGRLTAVFSWRDGPVTESEADIVLRQVEADLTGVDSR